MSLLKEFFDAGGWFSINMTPLTGFKLRLDKASGTIKPLKTA
jgi:hypothetical protein